MNNSRRRILSGLASSAALGALPYPLAAVSPRAVDDIRLRSAANRARSFDQLHSIIIAVDGAVRVAETPRGPALDRVVNVKSVAKTVVATLTGIALDRGILEDVDQAVLPLLRGHAPADPDPRLERLTIDHLLTMRAGLERTSGPNYGRWVASDDWIEFILTRPFVAEPGGRMLYSTGSYHLLSAALTLTSGRSLLELAREWLGEPLGITIPAWTRDPQGFYMGGNNMALSPNALLRFGEMFRLGGTWEGSRVVSRAWIDRAWQRRTMSPFSGDYYGYGWFIDTVRGYPARYARGYGGQIVHITPALGLTVVITSDPTRPARSGGYFDDLKSLLADDIIPAVAAG